jgi:hypothetical protein
LVHVLVNHNNNNSIMIFPVVVQAQRSYAKESKRWGASHKPERSYPQNRRLVEKAGGFMQIPS